MKQSDRPEPTPEQIRNLLDRVPDPDPSGAIAAELMETVGPAEVPDVITVAMLEDAKQKAQDVEQRRPDYDATDPEKLAAFLSWNFEALTAYQNQNLLISLKVREQKENGKPCEVLEKDLAAGRKRRAALEELNGEAWKALKEIERGRKEQKAPVISIGAKKIKKVKYPVDKLNHLIWDPDKMQGRRSADFKVEKSGSEKMIDIPLSLDFSKVEEVAPQIKELTEYQKRVWILSDALYRAGNNIISFDQIYKYTGRERKLSEKKDIDEINNAFSALNVEVVLNNKEEVDAGYKYSEADYHGAILPNKRIRDYEARILINGQETHGAIKILDKSDLLDFAIDRGQVAEVPVEVFQTPYQKTDQEIKLEDYFLTWIIRGLDSNKPKDRRRKLSTLYKEFHITAAKTNAGYKKRERFQNHIVDLLNFYAKQDLIINDRRLTGCEFDEYDELRLKYQKVRE